MEISTTKKTLHVLIVENNQVDIRMLTRLLSKSTYGSFETATADSLKAAFELLSTMPFDVILLDLNLQDSSGLETLRKVTGMFPDVAIVVNTGAYEDDLGLQAVTSGAQDYLIKGKYESYGLSKALYYALERKKAEKDLQTAYRRLKETQSQLIQIEKMNVVGGLASGIAHEVKNPLATILYGVEFLHTKLDQGDEQIVFTLQSIKDATNKANNIIKDLLDFASLSKLKTRPEDITDIIEHALTLTKHQCDKNNIKVVQQFSSGLPRVIIDKNRIEQVIVDVVINAILAMEKGGILTIKAYTEPLSAGDHEDIVQEDEVLKVGDTVLIVEISDTGSGIPLDVLHKIYDPFFTTRRAAGGVGLGLAVARAIMKNHRGWLTIGNLPGKGARARLIFRIHERKPL